MSQPLERDRHDAVRERRPELAQRGPGRAVQHLTVAVVARPVARTDVGGAVGAGDGAPFVGADRVDRRERGLAVRASRNTPAMDSTSTAPPTSASADPATVTSTPEPVKRPDDTPSSTARPPGDVGESAASATTGKHRGERGAGDRLTGSRAEPASGNLSRRSSQTLWRAKADGCVRCRHCPASL